MEVTSELPGSPPPLSGLFTVLPEKPVSSQWPQILLPWWQGPNFATVSFAHQWHSISWCRAVSGWVRTMEVPCTSISLWRTSPTLNSEPNNNLVIVLHLIGCWISFPLGDNFFPEGENQSHGIQVADRPQHQQRGWAPWSRVVRGNPGTRVFNHGGPKAGKDKAWWEKICAER